MHGLSFDDYPLSHSRCATHAVQMNHEHARATTRNGFSSAHLTVRLALVLILAQHANSRSMLADAWIRLTVESKMVAQFTLNFSAGQECILHLLHAPQSCESARAHSQVLFLQRRFVAAPTE